MTFDVAEDAYYVSNINGSPFAKDDNGFISKLAPDGTVVALKWIDGAKPDVTLNAPKGMAAMGGTLYVADLTVVRMFDVKTGKPKGEIKFPGATFINDVAADGGQLLVTDSGFKETKGKQGPSGTEAIYTVDYAGKILKTIKTDKTHKLNAPNGVAEGNYVVPFGAKQLLKNGKPVAELPYGMLDGIVGVVTTDNVPRFAISSWECTCILVGEEKGPYTELVKDLASPADIGWDAKRKHLLVPVLTENRIEIHPL